MLPMEGMTAPPGLRRSPYTVAASLNVKLFDFGDEFTNHELEIFLFLSGEISPVMISLPPLGSIRADNPG
jgi:hypothetical protein